MAEIEEEHPEEANDNLVAANAEAEELSNAAETAEEAKEAAEAAGGLPEEQLASLKAHAEELRAKADAAQAKVTDLANRLKVNPAEPVSSFTDKHPQFLKALKKISGFYEDNFVEEKKAISADKDTWKITKARKHVWNYFEHNPIQSILALTGMSALATLAAGGFASKKTWNHHAQEASGCYQVKISTGEFTKLDCGTYKTPGQSSVINEYCCYKSSANPGVTQVPKSDPNYPSAGPCLPTTAPGQTRAPQLITPSQAASLSVCKGADQPHAVKCPYSKYLCTPPTLGGSCTNAKDDVDSNGLPEYMYITICASGTDFFISTLNLLVNYEQIIPEIKVSPIIYIFTTIAAIGFVIAIIYEIIFIVKYRKKNKSSIIK